MKVDLIERLQKVADLYENTELGDLMIEVIIELQDKNLRTKPTWAVAERQLPLDLQLREGYEYKEFGDMWRDPYVIK